MKVFILMEEVDIVGVFASHASAQRAANDLELANYIIEEHKVND